VTKFGAAGQFGAKDTNFLSRAPCKDRSLWKRFMSAKMAVSSGGETIDVAEP
jgi:hypothetical protein